jgi:insulysin
VWQAGVLLFGTQVLSKCTDQQLKDTWTEAAGLAALRFNWQDCPEPLAAVQSAAYSLHYYAPNALLSGPRLMTGPPDPAVQRWFLQQLTPGNVNIFWSSKRHAQAVDSKERWYKAEYAVQQIPDCWLNSITQYKTIDSTVASVFHGLGSEADWHQSRAGEQLEQPTVQQPDELHLPEANWAMPQDLELRQGHGDAATTDNAAPQLVYEQPGLCVWHQLDTAFGLPKVR